MTEGARRLYFIRRLHDEARSRRAELLGAYVFPLVGVLLALSWLFENGCLLFVYDDSYITLGFARNIFLHGAPTLEGTTFWYGITSPLHVLLVALLARPLGGSVEASAVFLGVASIAFLVAAMYFWVREIVGDRKTALLASFLTATSGWIVFDALSGLETVTFMLFSVLVFYFLEKRNPYLVGLFMGLCVCTRPEGLFLLVAVIVFQLAVAFRDTVPFSAMDVLKTIGGEVGVTLVLVMPLLVANLVFTGSPAPSTGLTKAFFFAELDMGLSVKLQFFSNALQSWYMRLLFASPLVLVPAAFARYTWRRSYLYCYVFVFYFFYLAFFPGGLGHYWCRYQHVFLPIVFLLVAEGALMLLSLVRQRWRVLPVVLLVAFAVVNQWQSLATGQQRYVGSTASIEEVNISLAKWLETNTGVNDVIAVHDIGTMTYFLDEREVIDLVGLINHEIDPYYRDGTAPVAFSDRQILSYLLAEEVDYLVTFYSWKRFLNLDLDDTALFHLVHESEPVYGSDAIYRVYLLSGALAQRQ